MKILIVGGGGREHAIALAYCRNKKIKQVYVAPGNGLMDFQNKKITCCPDIQATDYVGVLKLAKKYKVDLIDVAQDDPLALGFVDTLQKEGFQTIGPTQNAAQIEWDKAWARSFMDKYKLPIPFYRKFTNSHEALIYLETIKEQLLFIKAAGLARGKGVIRADTKDQAKEAIKSMGEFGNAGKTFLIEEGMVGEEFSLFAFCDGDNFAITKVAQDHKRIYDGDNGPNTGGMGSVAPVGIATPRLIREVAAKIIKPFLTGMQKEGRPYSGVLYIGGMLTHSASSGQAKGVKIVEFNARWGEPEAEVIIPGLKTDYLTIVQSILKNKLDKLTVASDNKVRISIAGCANGYPGDITAAKGKEIFGLENAIKIPGITIYGSGLKRKGKRFFVDGGRIFHLVSEGKTIEEARIKAYQAMSVIFIEGNNLRYRNDIGWRDVERKYNKQT